MSSTVQSGETSDQTDDFLRLFRDYYREEIGKLAQRFPDPVGSASLYVEAKDLMMCLGEEYLKDWIDNPERMRNYAEEALKLFDLPADVDLSEANVRLVDSHGGYIERLSPARIGGDDLYQYVAIEGHLARVSGINFKIEEAVFECQRCSTQTRIPQGPWSLQKPHECQGCERTGPWRYDGEHSTKANQRKIKVEEPPDDRTQASNPQSVPGLVRNDLCNYGGEDGLPGRAGESVVVFGVLREDQSELEGRNASPETTSWLDVHAVHFEAKDETDIDLEAHRDDIAELEDDPDSIDKFVNSVAPELYVDDGDELAAAIEASVAWLFGSYRVDPTNGSQVRGDIHMALIGDPGLGKSTLFENLRDITPRCEFRSGTNLSEVGLTAAAEQEEWAGTTEWVLTPGVLVRGNSGHSIIDEIDAVVDDTTKAMHDALEGDQMVKVDKASISADLPSRTALLAGGNPVEGRFNQHEPLAQQIDLDPAFLDRMDIVFALQDEPDPNSDERKAEHILDSFEESAELERYERGEVSEPDHSDTVDAEVPTETFRAAVHYARQNIFPTLTADAKKALRDYYVEVRGANDWEDDAAIPATARTLEAGIRLSIAFARADFSDTVEPRHAERAIRISRRVVGLGFDPESGEFDVDMVSGSSTKSQRERKTLVKELVDELGDAQSGPSREDVVREAKHRGYDGDTIDNEIDSLYENGEIYDHGDGLRTT
jgi:replicative DNA helicase Mcm